MTSKMAAFPINIKAIRISPEDYRIFRWDLGRVIKVIVDFGEVFISSVREFLEYILCVSIVLKTAWGKGQSFLDPLSNQIDALKTVDAIVVDVFSVIFGYKCC